MLLNSDRLRCLGLPLAAAVVVLAGRLCSADEKTAGAPVNPSVEVTVHALRLQSFPPLNSVRRQLDVQLSVRNSTEKKLVLDPADLQFTVDADPGSVNLAITDPLLAGQKTLLPAQQITGWLGLQFQYPSSDEPKLVLTWQKGDESTSVSLNDALRTTAELRTEVLGPRDCLTVITINRSIDHLAIWLLNEEFRKLQKQGVQRVVLDAQKADSSALSTSSYRNMIAPWLASVSMTSDPRRFPFGSQLRSPVQFLEFYVVDQSTTNIRSYNSSLSNVFQPDREHAVAAALRSAYDNIAEQQALQDLQHAEAGIRRVALETSIDRLTSQQLTALLDQADHKSPDYQAMVAENLFRVALPEGVTALDRLVRSESHEVSQAAMRSLVRSVSPAAVTSVQKLWNESPDNEALIQDLVSAIIAARDFRHTDLLAEYAEQQLLEYSQTDRNPDAAVEDDTSQSASTRTSVRSSHPRTLQAALYFLREQDDVMFVDVARRELLNITDPTIQDIVLDFVLASATTTSRHLAEQYIAQRLTALPSSDGLTELQRAELERKYSIPGAPSGSRITSKLFSTIKQFPDLAYTPRLLELAGSGAVSSTSRREAFQAAMHCATDSQLDEIIDRFDSLDRSSRSMLLMQLSLLDHPRCLPLAEKCLQADENTAMIALGVLRNNQTPEAMNVMIRELDALRLRAEDAAEAGKKPDTKMLRLAGRFIDQLSSHSHRYIHPEACRMINRLRNSSIPEFAEMARQSLIRSNSTIPATLQIKITSAYNDQSEHNYAKSRTAFQEIIEEDPFYSHAYTTLASLSLREGLADEAMEYLKVADSLNPEDIHTQSMIALAEIQLGQISQGIQRAEEILKSVPDLATSLRCDTLYNTACTYGRAAEVEKDEKVRENQVERGIELLTDCVNRKEGFSDVSHMLADPDLNVFHDHPKWPSLVAKVAENEKQSPKTRR